MLSRGSLAAPCHLFRFLQLPLPQGQGSSTLTPARRPCALSRLDGRDGPPYLEAVALVKAHFAQSASLRHLSMRSIVSRGLPHSSVWIADTHACSPTRSKPPGQV